MIITRIIRDAKGDEPLYSVIEGSLDIKKFIEANPDLASEIKDLIIEKSQGGSGKVLLAADYLELLDFLKIDPKKDSSERAYKDYAMLNNLDSQEEIEEKLEKLKKDIQKREADRDKELKEIAEDGDLTDKQKELFTAKEKEESQEEIEELKKQVEKLEKDKNSYAKSRSKTFEDKYSNGYIAICDKVLDYIERKAKEVDSKMMVAGYNVEIEEGSIAISVFGTNEAVDEAFKKIFNGKEDLFKGNFLKQTNLKAEEIRGENSSTNYFNKSNRNLYKVRDGGNTMNGLNFRFKDGTVITVVDDEGKTFAQVKDEAIKVHKQMVASKMEAPELGVDNKVPEFKTMYKVVVGGKEIGCFDSLVEAEKAEAEAKAKEGIPAPEINDAEEQIEEVEEKEVEEEPTVEEKAVEEPTEESTEEVVEEAEVKEEPTEENPVEVDEEEEITVEEIKTFEDASKFKNEGKWFCVRDEKLFDAIKSQFEKMYAIKVGDRIYLTGKHGNSYETFNSDNHPVNDIEGLDVATLIKLGL